jgi:hypothetical protein
MVRLTHYLYMYLGQLEAAILQNCKEKRECGDVDAAWNSVEEGKG